MTISEWWQQVYPYAVELEKSITRSPNETNLGEATDIIARLSTILQEIEALPYSEDIEIMREFLIRSVTYLIHAYDELKNRNADEVDFYYSSALTQIAQLHYYLVQHGFAT